MQQQFSRNKLLTRVAGAFSPAALGNKLPGFLLSNPKIFKHENKAQTFTRRFFACSKFAACVSVFLMLFNSAIAQVVSGRVGVFRDSLYLNGVWYKSLQRSSVAIVVSSGPTFVIPDNTSLVYVDPPTTLDSLTIILPRNPLDGETVDIFFGGQIAFGSVVVTALTISPNNGQTIYAFPVSGGNAVGGDVWEYRFRASTNQWY